MQALHAGGATDAGNARTRDDVGLRDGSHSSLGATSQKRAFDSVRAFELGKVWQRQTNRRVNHTMRDGETPSHGK